MLLNYKVLIVASLLASLLHFVKSEDVQNSGESYHASPKVTGPAELAQRNSADLAQNDSGALLPRLDEAMAKISTVYMQSLFDGDHTPALEAEMRQLESDLYDMLNQLYQQQDGQLSDFMRYEANVTRQLLLYNLLKNLFGFGEAAAEDTNTNR